MPPVGTAVLRLAPAKECIRAEAMVSKFNANWTVQGEESKVGRDKLQICPFHKFLLTCSGVMLAPRLRASLDFWLRLSL